MGAKPLALHSYEKVTEGLDGLRERLDEYYSLGAQFDKWLAVITIGDDLPSTVVDQSKLASSPSLEYGGG